MNIRKIREDLGRVKTSCMRHDFPRALFLTIAALKELGGMSAPPDVRGDFRDALAVLTSTAEFKKAYSRPVSYQPGAERALLGLFVGLYKELKGQEDQEDYETTLQRKLNLDRFLKEGKLYLTQGKASEADASFAQALKYVKNETSVFAMMAKAMMDAGEYVRALGHVRNGLKVKPQDAELSRLGEECTRLRAESGK